MRLWRLHPSLLDTRGLVSTWREGLLARAVLRGTTRGYRHHPQLIRFRSHPDSVSAANNYLREITREADARGYRFDRSRIGPVRNATHIPVTLGQLEFELAHLRAKVRLRAYAQLNRLPSEGEIPPHPLFHVVDGPIESWEKGGLETLALKHDMH